MVLGSTTADSTGAAAHRYRMKQAGPFGFRHPARAGAPPSHARGAGLTSAPQENSAAPTTPSPAATTLSRTSPPRNQATACPSKTIIEIRRSRFVYNSTWSNDSARFCSAVGSATRSNSCPATVAGLVRALTTFPVLAVENKLALPAWSPARFRRGAARKAGAVEDVSCLVLDFDAGDPDDALAVWADHLVVMHTTWSHTPEAPRFRLVVPLIRPVPLISWARAWAWAVDRAPGADVACKDPSRLYFRPALPRPDAPHRTEVRVGALLDVLDVLPEPPPAAPAVRLHAPELCVPARLRDSAVRGRLMTDPASRERAAADAGATITGGSVRGEVGGSGLTGRDLDPTPKPWPALRQTFRPTTSPPHPEHQWPPPAQSRRNPHPHPDPARSRRPGPLRRLHRRRP